MNFGEPNPVTVARDFLNRGKRTYVVITNNLLDQPSNHKFLEFIGQGHLLNENERESNRIGDQAELMAMQEN